MKVVNEWIKQQNHNKDITARFVYAKVHLLEAIIYHFGIFSQKVVENKQIIINIIQINSYWTLFMISFIE